MYQHAFKENIHVPTTSIMQAKQDILTEFKVDNFISNKVFYNWPF